jgi:hypothetical protein
MAMAFAAGLAPKALVALNVVPSPETYTPALVATATTGDAPPARPPEVIDAQANAAAGVDDIGAGSQAFSAGFNGSVATKSRPALQA